LAVICVLLADLRLDAPFLEQTVLFLWNNLWETKRKTRRHWRW